MSFVDIHSHILPDLDDGACDMAVTCSMLEMVVSEGIEHLITTPHLRVGYMNYDHDKYNKNFQQVQSFIDQQGYPLTLYQGQELFFDYNNLKDVLRSEAYTMAGSRYVLFELPTFFQLDSLYEYLYEFELKDYRLILAHVERYQQFRDHPELLTELYHKGLLLQVNSKSVNSKDKKTKKWVDLLLKKGYVHFVATDAHSTGRRRPVMEESYAYAQSLIGDQASIIYRDNGLKVINNEDIITEVPASFNHGFFLRRRY